MFPYPSGTGLHVGHPLGYIGTDVYARFMRMRGHNVLHAMGYDAFGLPAEQYAVQTGQHPRATTEANVANMRRQLRALGLGHDPRRSIATTDVDYYRWTQWIFLQLYDSWYDDDQDRARPIAELLAEFEDGSRPAESDGQPRRRSRGASSTATPAARSSTRTGSRTSTRHRSTGAPRSAPCSPTKRSPPTGAASAATIRCSAARSKQWMLRITAYADRLLADLDLLDWPESIKLMQRNWIGRSVGAEVAFPVEEHTDVDIDVFTTRPDTLFGATYMVLAPEHPLVDADRPRPVARRTRRSSGGARFGLDKLPTEAVAVVPRVRGAEVGARAPGRGEGEDRRLHRRVRQEPHQRLEHPGVHRRLRADGLRHRGDHGRARARPARLRVRARVRPARSSASYGRPTPGCASAGSRPTRRPTMARGLRRRRRRHALGQRRGVARRPADGRREGSHHRLAGGGRRGRGGRHLQVARLAVQPAALLG